MRGCSVERQGCACTNATREAGVAASVHTVTANVIPEKPRKLEVMEQKLLLSDTTGFLVGIDWGFEIHGNLEPCLKQPGDVSLAYRWAFTPSRRKGGRRDASRDASRVK